MQPINSPELQIFPSTDSPLQFYRPESRTRREIEKLCYKNSPTGDDISYIKQLLDYCSLRCWRRGLLVSYDSSEICSSRFFCRFYEKLSGEAIDLFIYSPLNGTYENFDYQFIGLWIFKCSSSWTVESQQLCFVTSKVDELKRKFCGMAAGFFWVLLKKQLETAENKYFYLHTMSPEPVLDITRLCYFK